MKNKKEKIIASISTIVFHVIIILLLVILVVSSKIQTEEGGVPVNVGNIEVAMGSDLDLWEQQKVLPTPPKVKPKEVVEEDILTQDIEPSINIPPREPERPTIKEEPTKVKPTREQSKEEAQRLEEERKRDAARSRISNAFKNAQSNTTSRGTGTEGLGVEGSPDGNVRVGGKGSGVGGYGSWQLEGRGILGGGLPRPTYTGQTEGRIVVTITVDPSGNVINAAIGPGTNIDNHTLRQNALEAAKRAKFTKTEGIQNQKGTITYNFRLTS